MPKQHRRRRVFVVPALAFTRWGLMWAGWPVLHVMETWSDWIEKTDDMYDVYDCPPPNGYGRVSLRSA